MTGKMSCRRRHKVVRASIIVRSLVGGDDVALVIVVMIGILKGKVMTEKFKRKIRYWKARARAAQKIDVANGARPATRDVVQFGDATRSLMNRPAFKVFAAKYNRLLRRAKR